LPQQRVLLPHKGDFRLFRTYSVPARKAVLCSFKTFEEEGSVKEEKGLCAPTARSAEEVEAQP